MWILLFVSLHHIAKQYGLHVKESKNLNNVYIVREGRDWFDERDAERV